MAYLLFVEISLSFFLFVIQILLKTSDSQISVQLSELRASQFFDANLTQIQSNVNKKEPNVTTYH